MEYLVRLTPRARYFGQRAFRYPLSKRLGGSQSRSGRFREGKNILRLPVIEKGPTDFLARCLVTGWIILALQKWLKLKTTGVKEARTVTTKRIYKTHSSIYVLGHPISLNQAEHSTSEEYWPFRIHSGQETKGK